MANTRVQVGSFAAIKNCHWRTGSSFIGKSIMDNVHAEIGWMSESPSHSAYVLPTIHNIVERLYRGRPATILDVVCENEHIADSLAELGHFVPAVDSSPTAISIARTESRHVRFETCSI